MLQLLRQWHSVQYPAGMKTHLEPDEIAFLQLLRDSDYRVDPNTLYLVRVLTAKGLLFLTNNNSIVLLTTKAIELLDGGPIRCCR